MAAQSVAVVTAAGSGIGAACARELAARGDRVVLMSRSESAVALAAELDGVGIQGSVLVSEDLRRLVDTALHLTGRIDKVVNNTGHAPGTSTPTGRPFDPAAESHLLDLSDEDWHNTLDLYFLNVIRMSRILTPILQRQGGGSIVNVSAFGASESSYADPASSTIRRALAGFTKLYADKYGREGIRMNNVLPGYLNNWEWSDALLASIPAGRAGTVEELAKVVAFILSAEATYMTGQNILVDGGVNRHS